MPCFELTIHARFIDAQLGIMSPLARQPKHLVFCTDWWTESVA